MQDRVAVEADDIDSSSRVVEQKPLDRFGMGLGQRPLDFGDRAVAAEHARSRSRKSGG